MILCFKNDSEARARNHRLLDQTLTYIFSDERLEIGKLLNAFAFSEVEVV